MSKLVFPEPQFKTAREGLLADARETCATFYLERSHGDRWLVRDGALAPDNAYRVRTPIAAELKPEYLVEVSARARREQLGMVLTHTHPFSITTAPEFSPIDDQGERPLATFLSARIPQREHFAMVVSPGGLRARRLGGNEPVAIETVGQHVQCLFDLHACTHTGAELYDRQVRAFGERGQRTIARLAVGIVGLGGTGSVLAQEVAHLGISRFLLIDHDALETSNRNRVVGSEAADLGVDKVAIAERMIKRINANATVEGIRGDVLDACNAARLVEVDFLFICTDSHASRALAGQLAYQHLIPAIDVGVAVVAAEGQVRHIVGRVQMLAPGLACLACTRALDGDVVRRELMTAEHRTADPYFVGGGEPQPAVISLNATMSSLAVTMFLSATTGIPAAARYQRYDAVAGVVRPVSAQPAERCVVCSPHGALARGANWALPTRGASS